MHGNLPNIRAVSASQCYLYIKQVILKVAAFWGVEKKGTLKSDTNVIKYVEGK